jgi:5-methylcytosine-specific restriction endonuclease McrA
MNKRSKDLKKSRPDLFKLSKGPNGRNLCRWCKTEVKPPRRTFCSEECVHEWRIITDWTYARRQVIKRDKSICQICSIDLKKLRKEFRQMNEQERLIRAEELKIPKFKIGHSFIEVDHIVPWVEGGTNELTNLRVLCPACHRIQTNLLLVRIKNKKMIV